MVEKAKIFYFTVFILVVFAFIFHITAMGHPHWKRATSKYGNETTNFNYITVGLFTRCSPIDTTTRETCFPNKFPLSDSCFYWAVCLSKPPNDTCQCDFLPSTKGIAACAIIASVFLGLAIIILFIHSINTSETRSIGLILGFFPLFLLLLAFIFILIALILVGSYLSRDIMHVVRPDQSKYIYENYKKKSYIVIKYR
jgi:hypothetical protein